VTPNDIVVEPTRTLPTATSLPVSTTALPVTSGETFTPLATEALAPLPTLSPVEAKAFVLELPQNNGGCELPCFWGFTPGQTKWQTAEPLLTSFAYQIDYGAPDGTFSTIPVGTSFVAWVYLYFPEKSIVPISYIFTVQNEVIIMIEAHILPTSRYPPSTILTTHEQPAEVWLLTANSPSEGVLGFIMTLFYDQHGFMLRYGSQGTIEDGKVRSCFLESSYEVVLAAWLPQEELTYAEAVSRFDSFGKIEYDLPLEEAIGMSLDSFYETFSSSGEPLCLETPTDLWPGP
jgi:hypothetical protein